MGISWWLGLAGQGTKIFTKSQAQSAKGGRQEVKNKENHNEIHFHIH